MIPPGPAVFAELAARLMGHATPQGLPGALPEDERASDLGLAALLLGVAAERWDGLVAMLVEENRAVRALLGLAGDDADLRISALTAENNRLRAALVEAHAAAEAAGDTERCEAIWAELVAQTERRRISTAPC